MRRKNKTIEYVKADLRENNKPGTVEVHGQKTIVRLDRRQLRQHDREYREWCINNGLIRPKGARH